MKGTSESLRSRQRAQQSTQDPEGFLGMQKEYSSLIISSITKTALLDPSRQEIGEELMHMVKRKFFTNDKTIGRRKPP